MASSLTIDTDMYMKLLVAEMKNQDPEAPMDNGQMITQMSQLATVDGINKLNTSFADMLKLTQLSSSLNLVGHQVEYTQSDTGQLAYGVVNWISSDAQGVQLNVGGRTVALNDITKVL